MSEGLNWCPVCGEYTPSRGYHVRPDGPGYRWFCVGCGVQFWSPGLWSADSASDPRDDVRECSPREAIACST